MNYIKPFVVSILLIVLSASCAGPRDAGTSSARAAYASPSSNTYRYTNKNNKKKKTRSNTARTPKNRNVDEARERRKGIGM